MTPDLEEHVRRSLAVGVRDVDPDPATWDAVQERIRRRAVARRAAVGLATAAALLVAALVVPGLVTETRIDLSPADPGALSQGASGLVHTDGRQIVFTDGTDEAVVVELVEAAAGQAIRRLAVRPGSDRDDLTVAYLVSDPDCDRAEMRWVTVDRAGTRGGFLDEGGSYCLTDPVWSPDGAVAAWVRQQPPSAESFEPAPAAAGNVHLLALQGWHDDGSQGGEFTPSPMAAQSTHLDLSSLEEGVAPVRALRVTGWVWSGEAGTLHLSAAHEDRSVQAGRISAIPRPGNPADLIDVPTQPQPTDDPNGPGEYPSAVVEPVGVQGDARALVTVGDPHAYGGLGDRAYSLALGATGGVEVQRAVGGNSWTLELPDHVLPAGQADGAWLSAWGDTVVLGAGGDAWVVHWLGASWGEPEALPGVVHADVLGRLPAGREPAPMAVPDLPADPAGVEDRVPQPSPPDPGHHPLVVTDGDVITLRNGESQVELAGPSEAGITALAVRPGSTSDDLTLVWREGGGCDATLRWARVVSGSTGAQGTLPAACPGRPVFAPDGGDLVWLTQREEQGYLRSFLVTLDWVRRPSPDAVEHTLLPSGPIDSLDLVDWEWREGADAQDPEAAARGFLWLVSSADSGRLTSLPLWIERRVDDIFDDSDGSQELVLYNHHGEPDGTLWWEDTGLPMVAIGHRRDRTPPAFYAVRARGEDLELARSQDVTTTVRLPAGLVAVDGHAAEVERVWMSARGDDVLLGDGSGRAWRIAWTADGWGELYEVDGTVRYGVPLQDRP